MRSVQVYKYNSIWNICICLCNTMALLERVRTMFKCTVMKLVSISAKRYFKMFYNGLYIKLSLPELKRTLTSHLCHLQIWWKYYGKWNIWYKLFTGIFFYLFLHHYKSKHLKKTNICKGEQCLTIVRQTSITKLPNQNNFTEGEYPTEPPIRHLKLICHWQVQTQCSHHMFIQLTFVIYLREE